MDAYIKIVHDRRRKCVDVYRVIDGVEYLVQSFEYIKYQEVKNA